MPFSQMINEHTSSFKTDQTLMTFINETIVIGRIYLRIFKEKYI